MTSLLDERARTSANIIDALAEWSSTAPDRAALRAVPTDYLSYGELFESVQHIAGGLAALGVKAGDTVLLMLPNGVEVVQAWLATNYVGAIEVPVNVHDRGRFLEHIVRDSQASVAIVHASLLERFTSLDSALRDVVVVGASDGAPPQTVSHGRFAIHSWELLAQAAPLLERSTVAPGDLVAIFYTSGTTGPAKGIMFTYGQAALCSENLSEALRLTDADTYYVCMPLFHSNAQIMQVMPALIAGARVAIASGFSAETWLDDIRNAGATVTNTLGVMSQSIFDQPARPDDKENPLRVIQTIPMPAAIAHAFEERFAVTCVDGYGLTDAGILSFRRLEDPLTPGASGRPLPGFEIIVADPETDRELPVGMVGEILVRPMIPFGFMAGYWNNPEATVAAWRNLWFHSGDAGYFNERGELFFHERLKDAIRVRGENISSAQVEAEFLRHPSIEECAAVAVPSDRGDDEIKLCVVLRAGEELTAEDLLRSCSEEMPYFAVPRYVEFLPELPKTATGKVRKVELRGKITGEVWDRKAAGFLIAR